MSVKNPRGIDTKHKKRFTYKSSIAFSSDESDTMSHNSERDQLGSITSDFEEEDDDPGERNVVRSNKQANSLNGRSEDQEAKILSESDSESEPVSGVAPKMKARTNNNVNNNIRISSSSNNNNNNAIDSKEVLLSGVEKEVPHSNAVLGVSDNTQGAATTGKEAEDGEVKTIHRTASALVTSADFRTFINSLSEERIYELLKQQPVHNSSLSPTSCRMVLQESLLISLCESIRILSPGEAAKLIRDVVGNDEKHKDLVAALSTNGACNNENSSAGYKAAPAAVLRSKMRNARQELHQPMIESAHRFHGTIPDDIVGNDPLPPSARDLDRPHAAEYIPLLQTTNMTRRENAPSDDEFSTPTCSPSQSRRQGSKSRGICRQSPRDADSCSSSISSGGSDSSRSPPPSMDRRRKCKTACSPSTRRQSRRRHHHSHVSPGRHGRAHTRCRNMHQPQRFHTPKKKVGKKTINRGFFSILFSKLSFSLDGLTHKFHKKTPVPKIHGILKTAEGWAPSTCAPYCKSVKFGNCDFVSCDGVVVHQSPIIPAENTDEEKSDAQHAEPPAVLEACVIPQMEQPVNRCGYQHGTQASETATSVSQVSSSSLQPV